MSSDEKKATSILELSDKVLIKQIDEEFRIVDTELGADWLGGPMAMMEEWGPKELSERQISMLTFHLLRIAVRQNELMRRGLEKIAEMRQT